MRSERVSTPCRNNLGGIPNAAVDVAEFLEREEICSVLGAVKDVGTRPADRKGARVGGGIRCLASVEADGV